MSIILSLSLSFSLSLPLFFRLIPWSIEALCAHLSAWASKTWKGRRSASSLPWETGRAPVAYVNRASPCLGALLAFCVNKGISASILSSLIHSFIHRCHFSCGFPWILWGWTLADSWDAYQRNDFKEPILLHLPIHRKVLNSLTCDVRFFFN